MKTQKLQFVQWLYIIVLATALTGCEPMKPSEKEFFEAKDRERSQREARLRAVNEAVTPNDVIARVKSNPSPDGNGTTEDWLIAQMQIMKGQSMLPRWSTTRRGSNKQEVTFEFVFIDEQNQMQRLSYTWDVDVLDMTVGPARLTHIADISSPDQNLAQQHERRVREHERQLE